MSRVITILTITAVIIIGLALHLRNEQLVTVDYYLNSVDIPLSLVIASALLTGAILGILASVPMLIKLKHENGKLLRKVNVSEKELNNLRVIPIKDTH